VKEIPMRKMELVDRERYEVLKSMLQDRATEIVDKLRNLRETLPDELAEVKDPEEQCMNEFVQGLDFALIEMKSRTLARINDALHRLEQGHYGICEDCEQEIGNARLQALPFADRCRDCQQAREDIAADTVKQQSRFALPTQLDAEPSDAPPPAVAAPGRPGRDFNRTTRRTPGRLGAQPVRKARPGQLALREQVAGMERSSAPLRPQVEAPKPVTKTRAVAGRVARPSTRTRKHA
jgi:DnaK suppressor protein